MDNFQNDFDLFLQNEIEPKTTEFLISKLQLLAQKGNELTINDLPNFYYETLIHYNIMYTPTPEHKHLAMHEFKTIEIAKKQIVLRFILDNF